MRLPKPFNWFYEYEKGFWTRTGGRATTAITVDQQANIANICSISWKYTHTYPAARFKVLIRQCLESLLQEIATIESNTLYIPSFVIVNIQYCHSRVTYVPIATEAGVS